MEMIFLKCSENYIFLTNDLTSTIKITEETFELHVYEPFYYALYGRSLWALVFTVYRPLLKHIYGLFYTI